MQQGRADADRVLIEAMDRLRTRGASTYLVLGEGGIGKTHLLHRTLAEARERGWTCLYAGAHDYDRDISYATLRNLVGVLDGDRVPEAVRGVAAELRTALDDVVLADPNGTTSKPTLSPLVLSTRLLHVMTELSPVVVVIDDAHLADEDSLVAVTLAARHLAGRPLLLVFASRTRPWTAGEGLVGTIGHLVNEQVGTVLELGPVEEDSLVELVQDVLAATPDTRLVDYLARRARGNALLTCETLSALQGSGAIRVERGTAYLVDDSPPLFSRRGALLYRVFARDHLGRELARLVSVFGRVDLDHLPVLAELCGRPIDEVRVVFDALIANGTLSEAGSGWYEFRHPLIGELLYGEVGPAERRRVHAAISTWSDDSGRELRMPPLERARHVTEGAARGDRAAIAIALRTADQALRTSPNTAARWYGCALALLDDADATTGEVLSRQTVAYWKASRPTLALETGQRALSVLGAGRSHDRTVATMVNCFNAIGDLQSAAGLLVDEMGHVLDPTPCLAQLAAMTARLGDTNRARELAVTAWAQVRTSSPADQVIAYTYLGQVEAAVGTGSRVIDAVAELERLGADELELPVGARTSALESAAHIAGISGDSRRADDLLGLSLDSARAAGFQDIGGQAGLARALVAFATGEWDAATEEIAREAVHLEHAGLSGNLARLRNVEVQVLIGRGDFRRANQVLAVTEPQTKRGIDHAIWQAMKATVDVARLQFDQAIPVLQRLRSRAADCGWNEVLAISYAALIESHLALGDLDEAARVADDFCRHAEATGLPRDRLSSGIAWALAHGDADSGIRVLDEALAGGMHSIVAQTRHALGAIGHEPADNLHSAWTAFRDMGASLWLKRVEGTARSRGIVLGRDGGDTDPTGSLSDIDRQIIGFLGDGFSNRQIADLLHYSPKTIEAYLTRLYKKTGCTSRVGLIVAHERGDLDLRRVDPR